IPWLDARRPQDPRQAGFRLQALGEHVQGFEHDVTPSVSQSLCPRDPNLRLRFELPQLEGGRCSMTRHVVILPQRPGPYEPTTHLRQTSPQTTQLTRHVATPFHEYKLPP